MNNGATVMTTQAMQEVLDGLRPGDRIRIVFKDMEVETIRIQMILVLCAPISSRNPTIDLGELPALNLMSVGESGQWHGFRSYKATILEGFDPEDFAYRTLRHDLLESIEKL